MIEAGSTVGLMLAAGTATRFGGGKVRADLDGRPLLAHVLAAARAARLGHMVVVLGRDATAVDEAMRRDDATAWAAVLRLLNPAPERGLASSVRLGMAAATAIPGACAILVLPGDQPRVRPGVIATLLAAAAPGEAIAIAPRYAGDASSNPVLLLPSGWPLAAELDGDRGFGPLLARHADRVLRVDAAGANPDVDTAGDLAELRA